MFRQVFNTDNLLWRIIASGVDFVGISLFWAFLCLPVITIAPATAALYYTTVKVFRHGADDGFTTMWKAFCANLKKGILISLISIPIMIGVCYGYSVMYANAGSALGAVMFVAYYIALVIPIGMLIYLFAYMGRFDLKITDYFKNSLILCIMHLPSTIILVLLVIELILATIKTWAVVFLAPVGGALLISFFLEPIFWKYVSLEEQAVLRNMTVDQILEEQEKKNNRKKIK